MSSYKICSLGLNAVLSFHITQIKLFKSTHFGLKYKLQDCFKVDQVYFLAITVLQFSTDYRSTLHSFEELCRDRIEELKSAE